MSRVKVACINWGHDSAPKALSYILRDDDEMVAEDYHWSWDEAVERSRRLAASLARSAGIA